MFSEPDQGLISRRAVSVGLLATLAGCSGTSPGSSNNVGIVPQAPTPTPTPTPQVSLGVSATPVATFASPWSLVFLPTGEMIVSQRLVGGGALSIVSQSGQVSAPLTGLPSPSNGVLDVQLDPNFGLTGRIFFSYIEIDPTAPRIGRPQDAPNEQPESLAVASARLVRTAGGGSLTDLRVVWRQQPKIVTPEISGNFGGKIAFSADGRYLFIANGDRQELVPDLIESRATTVGKIVRILPDGTIPSDNPFFNTPGVLPEIWTLGHRNPYGLAFDPVGRLWENENGPMGGDELNLILPGRHYGWPFVSNGDNYNGDIIPDHSPGDGYEPPVISWTPSVAPSDMIFYSGAAFSSWRGDAIITTLRGMALIRVRFAGTSAMEVQRIAMGNRIRAIAEAPDGNLWVLEDGTAGRLLRLTPVPL